MWKRAGASICSNFSLPLILLHKREISLDSISAIELSGGYATTSNRRQRPALPSRFRGFRLFHWNKAGD